MQWCASFSTVTKELKQKEKKEKSSHCNKQKCQISAGDASQCSRAKSLKDTVACGVKAWPRMGRVNTLFWFLRRFRLLISCTKKNPVQLHELCDVWYVEQTAAGSMNSPLQLFLMVFFFFQKAVVTSKPSRVSGVYSLLTLIEMKRSVLLSVRVGSRVEVFTGCLFGWVDWAAGCFPRVLPHSFTGIRLAQSKGNAGCGRLSLPGVKASPGRWERAAGYGSGGENKAWQPDVRVFMHPLWSLLYCKHTRGKVVRRLSFPSTHLCNLPEPSLWQAGGEAH